jgi:hypothetical protein
VRSRSENSDAPPFCAMTNSPMTSAMSGLSATVTPLVGSDQSIEWSAVMSTRVLSSLPCCSSEAKNARR